MDGGRNPLAIFNPNVLADLRQVNRVGIKCAGGWANFDSYRDDFPQWQRSGFTLRRDLRGFKRRKEVWLSRSVLDGGSCKEPGVTILKDYKVEWPCDAGDLARYSRTTNNTENATDITTIQSAHRVMSSFKTQRLSRRERKYGTPGVKLVKVCRILNLPPFQPKGS